MNLYESMIALPGKAEDLARVEDELRHQRRELEYRERELILRSRELALSRWSNPIFIAVMGAFIAAMANIWVSYHTAVAAERLEKTKWEHAKSEERLNSLSANVVELSSLLNITLEIQAEALDLLGSDLDQNFIGKKRVVKAYAYWERDDFKKVFSKIKAILVQIGIKNPIMHDELRYIVRDVMAMHAFTRDTSIKYFSPTYDGAKSSGFDYGRLTFSLRASTCASSLGPRISETFSRVTSAEKLPDAKPDRAICAPEMAHHLNRN